MKCFLFSVTLALLSSCFFQKVASKDTITEDCAACGIQMGSGTTSLILGGTVVMPVNKYPWMVFLLRTKTEFQKRKQSDGSWKRESVARRFSCGGSIIDQYTILTAAHCVSEIDDNGEVSVYKPEEMAVKFITGSKTTTTARSPVNKIFVHPKYNRNATSDIAVVKLKYKIKCDTFANPICLPPPNLKVKEGSISIAAGWGRIDRSGDKKNNLLRESRLKHINYDKCASMMERTVSGVDYKGEGSTELCLANFDGKGPCKGDSGGPIFREMNGKIYILGVSTKTIKLPGEKFGCNPKYPSMYTKVTAFMDWIQRHMGGGSPR